MKLIRAVINNFKDIDAKEVNFSGRSVAIIGKNSVGKSSLMQAIASPMNSKVIPLEPIKEGEDHARVELQIAGQIQGVDKDLTIEMEFSEANKKGKVVAYDSEGQKLSAQKRAVEDLIGAISFDVFEFARKGLTASGTVSKGGVKDQIEILKGFLSDEEKKRLHEAKERIDELTEERKDIKRKEKEVQQKIEESTVTEEEAKKYKEHKDEQPVLDKIHKLDKEIENYNYVETQVRDKEKRLEDGQKMIDEIHDHIYEKALELVHLQKELYGKPVPDYSDTSLESIKNGSRPEFDEFIESLHHNNWEERDHDGLRAEISKGKRWLEEHEKPSNEKLMEELESIREHNRKVDEVKKTLDLYEDRRTLKGNIQKLDAYVKEAEKAKNKVFEESSLPVEGLTFDEDQVLYNGLPFNENQIPTSDIIKVGAKIGIAMDKNLKMLTVRDGSLLDDSSLKELIALVEENDHQLLIEQVSDSELEVRFTEDIIQ